MNADTPAGCADTGCLANDITEMFVALGHAAADYGNAVVFLLEEIQLNEFMVPESADYMRRNYRLNMMGSQ
ncbi:MAG: hypothetical protein ACRDT4_14035 [Micromonosporaceae bacterium]